MAGHLKKVPLRGVMVASMHDGAYATNCILRLTPST